MTVQEAIEKAREYLRATLPEYAGAEWHLEEVETATHRGNWLVTFSAILEREPGADKGLAAWLRPVRMTKSVELDPNTGELLAVRNRAA